MPAEQTTLLFHSNTPGLSRAFSRRKALAFAKRLATEVTHGRPFTCLITSDLELQRLNRDFRKKDYPADARFPRRHRDLFPACPAPGSGIRPSRGPGD